MQIRIFIAGLLFLLLQGCAKISSPTGGPEDVYPPQYVSGVPENRSVDFSDDQIDINFNEYIQLKDQNKEILISPPMKEKPVVRIRERSIRVTFNEELIPQTTYTLNFGKSLSDLNEGNELPDFEYVFSTGSVIDSLSVTGKILDASTLKPETESSLLVMLYENLADSAPMKEIPRYYGKTNKYGMFAVNNIHPDTFRIIALKDGNNNLLYDAGLENIAFADSFLIINAGNVKPQTYIKDTVKIITQVPKSPRGSRKDTTTVADTVIAPGKLLNALNISMYSFMEENNKVFIASRNRESPEQLSFVFNRPLFDSLQVTPVNFSPDSSWYLLESSRNNDTLTYWITDSLISGMDTLLLSLSYLTTDSAGLLSTRTDTIRLRKPAVSSRGERGGGGRRLRDEAAAATKKSLSLTGSIASRGRLDLTANLVFTAARPIRTVQPDSIELSVLRDTLFIPQPFTFQADTLSARRFRLSGNWKEETQYKLVLMPGAVLDIYGLTNDSTEIRFSTREEDYYARILLNFSSPNYPMLIQVLDEKGAVVKSGKANSAGIITFEYLSPGRYLFKAIYDENGNGKWDTGNYLKHQQPEKVYISGRAEQLRSNWDYEPTWTITGE